MSVIIKGMEMPSCCLMCQMYTISGCRVSKRIFPDWMNVAAVPKDCPLVPLPEGHGRLIDAEALCAGLVSNHPVVIYAKNAPTIVPAEGGGEDG